MKPARVVLDKYTEGDRFSVISGFGPITINGLAPSVPLEKVRLQFRDKFGVLGYTYSSDPLEGANIVITDANTWEGIFIAEDDFPLTKGCWHWDIEYYAQGNLSPYTLHAGKLTVLCQETLPVA